MKGGRKNLKRAAKDQILNLQHGQSVMQVLSLRGSNLIEVHFVISLHKFPLTVIDARGQKSLALFPAKFQKSMWIKRDRCSSLRVNLGSFVVVDESGKEKALKSGCKVACIVSQVLFYDQVRELQKSPEWPEIFKSSNLDDSNENDGGATSESLQRDTTPIEVNDEIESSDEDGLPPLEANLNRIRPFELQSDRESDSGSDTD
ncbi:putative RNA-binding protein EIF1AD [Gossypium australe]|uniref:Putative RNA-binding protein EIF1AD n=1 Tax=Gossypium australe TaxID=47621 RepID=A0A5B6WHG6_9ROSI|nr:putative RNA-binding protein EIF1AD [Gossypium australe]